MSRTLSINLFTDTFSYADESKFDVIIYNDLRTYLNYKSSALLPKEYVLSNFPSEVHEKNEYMLIDEKLYERFSHTGIVVHLTENMPDLSSTALTSKFFEHSSWKPIIATACVQAMYEKEFCVCVKRLWHDDILATLACKKMYKFQQIHLYFNEEAVEVYNGYGCTVKPLSDINGWMDADGQFHKVDK